MPVQRQAPKTNELKAPSLQNIDRFNFLNDQFDNFDEFEENNMILENQNKAIMRSGSGLAFNQNLAAGSKKWDYHKPADAEQALSTLRLMKDLTLFNSPLSQAQIKAEI